MKTFNQFYREGRTNKLRALKDVQQYNALIERAKVMTSSINNVLGDIMNLEHFFEDEELFNFYKQLREKISVDEDYVTEEEHEFVMTIDGMMESAINMVRDVSRAWTVGNED